MLTLIPSFFHFEAAEFLLFRCFVNKRFIFLTCLFFSFLFCGFGTRSFVRAAFGAGSTVSRMMPCLSSRRGEFSSFGLAIYSSAHLYARSVFSTRHYEGGCVGEWRMLPALRKIKNAVGKTAWMPQMLCSGLCERVASGTVSISLRYSVGRLCARV